MCYGKKVGFGNQSMKIAKASSRRAFRSLRDRTKDGEMLSLPCFAERPYSYPGVKPNKQNGSWQATLLM